MCTSDDFNHVTALELGAGTGLAGLVMARVASVVFITDRGGDILDNCIRNVFLNLSSLTKGEQTARVRELDWQKSWPPHISYGETRLQLDKICPYQWTPEDMKDLGNVSVLLAADVVYSKDLTSAFFEILKKLMPPNSEKVLYLAMEKRYNFSLTDLDVVAHDYKHFRTFFTSECSWGIESDCASNNSEQGIENLDVKAPPHSFYGKKVDVSRIDQYLRNYDRGNDLELWEIRPRKDAGNLCTNRD